MSDFENTYKENYPKMFRIATKMTNDKEVANDIVQEVFVYYFEKLENDYLIQKLQSWMIRAVINKCVDYLKRRKKHIQLNTAITMADEEKNYEIQQSGTILKQAISKLKPMEMKLIILYSEGYSYKEIAQMADINFSSVGKTLSRSLIKLKEILKRMNYEMY